MAPDGSVIIDTKIDTKELKSQLENVKKSLDDASKYYNSLGKEGASAFKEIETQFKKIDAAAKISGDEIKALGDKKEVLQKKIDTLIKSGLKPEDLQVKALKKTYDELTRAQTISSTAIEQKTKTLKQSLGNIKTSYLALTAAITAGVVVVSKIVKGISDLDKAYKVQLMAERALEQASKNNPYLDSNSVNRLKAYASELQKVSNVGDEVSIGLMTQLASAGRTEAQIREMMKTAIDMEAAGFGTVEGNVRNLNKLFGGLTGELGEIIPELKNFTKEQLQNGEALDMLSKKYDGMASSVIDKSVQIQNAIGDLKEVIGEIGASTGLTDIFQNSLLSITEWYTSGIAMFNDWVSRMRGTKEYSIDVLKQTRDERIALMLEERKKVKEINDKLNETTDTNTRNYLTQAFEERMTELNRIQDGITMLNEEIAQKEKELAEANKKTIITTGEEITEAEKKQIEGRIAAQQQYEKAVNLATEKQKGGLITLEEKWDDIKSAASAYTDELINLGYTYEETATIGGKALEDMRRKLTGDDLSKGLEFSGVIGGEGFLNPLVRIAEQWKITIPVITGLMEDSGDKAGKELTDSMASAIDNTSINVADSVGMLLGSVGAAITTSVAIVKKIFSGIKAVAMFDPQAMYDSFTEIITGLTKFFEKVGSLPSLVESGKKVLGEFIRGMVENRETHKETFANVVKYLLETARDVLPLVIEFALMIITDLATGIIENLPLLIEAVLEIGATIRDGIIDMIPEILVASLLILPAMITEIIKQMPESIKTLITLLPDITKSLLEGIIENLPELVMGIIEAMLYLFIGSKIDLAIALIEIFADIVKDIIEDIGSLFNGVAEAAIAGWLQGWVDGWNKMVKGIKDFCDSVINKFKEIFGIHSPSTVFKNFGGNILQGLVNGITEFDIWGKIKNVFNSVINKFKETFGIHSPSTVFAGFGEMIMEGLKNGITGANIWDGIKSTFTTIIDNIKKLFSAETWTDIGTKIKDGIGGAVTEADTKAQEVKEAATQALAAAKAKAEEAAAATKAKAEEAAAKAKTLAEEAAAKALAAAAAVKAKAEEAAAKAKTTLSDIGTGITSGVKKLGGWIGGLFHADGTNNHVGGKAIINEEGAELVTLPSGSKVMTANATAQMQDRAISQLLAGMKAPSFAMTGGASGRSITIQNKIDTPIMVNESVFGRLVYQTIDKAVL